MNVQRKYLSSFILSFTTTFKISETKYSNGLRKMINRYYSKMKNAVAIRHKFTEEILTNNRESFAVWRTWS